MTINQTDDSQLLRYRSKDLKLVLIDIETFNLCLSFNWNRPWQTSLLFIEGDKIVRKEDRLTKWETDLTIGKGAAMKTRFYTAKNKRWDNLTMADAIEKHGESERKTFDLIYPSLEKADLIIGHNILGFDIHLIKEWYLIHNKPYVQLLSKIVDTYCLYKAIAKQIKFHSNKDTFLGFQFKIYHKRVKGVKGNLMAVGKKYKIEHDYEGLHDALVDLELNYKVFEKIKWDIEI